MLVTLRQLSAPWAIVVAAIIGLAAAGGCSAFLSRALEDPLLTECLATGTLVFTKPISESRAREVSEYCRAGLYRRDILARATPSLGLSVMSVVVGTAARFLDPVHDLMALVFGGAAYLLLRVARRPLAP